ncbi:PREDICTED: glutamate-1-semialdehyde 2,1-aminomutase-like, partial [Priapulus caudatus]|uniref:Glutamate-1-semialdehyde 2,1-aminomutase-like n=1 Tax=Priapulus caudatus TaxID=37621 RepID=A0ABM1F7E7_PRICU
MPSPATQSESSKQQNLFGIADRVLPGAGLGSYSLAEEIRLIYSHGKGSRLWDVDNNEYIDYVGGAGALILGHSHPAVVDASKAQLDRGAHMFGIANDCRSDISPSVWSKTSCGGKTRALLCRTLPEATVSTMLVCPYNDLATLRKIVGEHGHDIAAIFAEPVQRIIPAEPEFLQGIRKICDEYDILFVLDE